MIGWAASWGVPLPAYPDLVAGGAALLLVLLSGLVAMVAGRRIGPHVAALAEHKVAEANAGIVRRACVVVRYLVAAILLAIVLKADAWPPLAAFILSFALASCVGRLVAALVTGLNLPRWASLVAALVAFVAVLAEGLGGLEPVVAVLDGIGFSVGKTRLSLLTLTQVAATLLALYAIFLLVNRLLSHSIRRAGGLDPTQQILAQKLVAIALLIAIFFVGVDLLGIDLTALAVFSGALGLAVGFGLQKTFGNLIAGIILLMDRSIKPGDVISVGESFGSVNKIGVRAVSIVARDGKEYLIPNENLMTQEVINWSYSSRDVRISIPVGVSHDSDILLAQRLMLEAVKASPRVLANPQPNVWLVSFGESAIHHELRVWISDPEAGIGPVQSDILNRIWVLFRENGVRVPYAQRDIHVRQWTAEPRPAAES